MENREIFTQHYTSPLGGILLAADECGLTGLWFDGQKYFGGHLPAAHTERQTPILAQTKRWLDLYFAGKKPDFLPLLHPRRLGVSPGGLGAFAADPLWADDDLWRACQAACGEAAGGRGCPPRPSAGRWGTMKFRFSSRATGSSGRTAA